MGSLSTKLVLAFALTSLTSVALAALLVRQFVATEFDAYRTEQRHAKFVEQASEYYSANGSWADVTLAAFESADNWPPPQSNNGPPNGGPRNRDDFMLVDASGTIIVSSNPLEHGKQANRYALERGLPVVVNGETVGTVISTGPAPGRTQAELRYLARTDLALGAAALGAVTVATILGLLLARLITRPVRDLIQATRGMAAGALRQQVPVRSRDELGVLAAQFNAMSADMARATELRRRMTADIAHDLRTPLTVISGYLEALRDETLRPTPTRFTAMHDESQILLRLVEDLHTLSLADAGELALKRQAVAPERLIERVAQSYQHAANQAGIAVATQVAPNLPTLQLDVEQTARVLSNLVSNALRHTPAGGTVTLSAASGPREVRFEVADTGHGIAAEHLPNIFERFYRADAARQQANGGSGLGLAIVRSIVEAHGGQVAVRSVLGQGTTFVVTLPVAG